MPSPIAYIQRLWSLSKDLWYFCLYHVDLFLFTPPSWLPTSDPFDVTLSTSKTNPFWGLIAWEKVVHVSDFLIAARFLSCVGYCYPGQLTPLRLKQIDRLHLLLFVFLSSETKVQQVWFLFFTQTPLPPFVPEKCDIEPNILKLLSVKSEGRLQSYIHTFVSISSITN